MLKVSKSEVSVCGTQLELMAEFALLAHSFLENNVATEQDLDVCISLAKTRSAEKRKKEDESKESEDVEDGSEDTEADKDELIELIDFIKKIFDS